MIDEKNKWYNHINLREDIMIKQIVFLLSVFGKEST